MSALLFSGDVLFYQRFLKSNGYYKKELDSKWGSGTDAADKAFVAESQKIAAEMGTFDARSERCIQSLVPMVQIMARSFLQHCKAAKLDVRIISGTRSYAEQDALYKKGRFGNKEGIVTKARGGQSNHNFGMAFDIGVFKAGEYMRDENSYIHVGNLILPKVPGLQWGGNWRSFKDYPHYEGRTVAANLKELRALFEDGKPYVG